MRPDETDLQLFKNLSLCFAANSALTLQNPLLKVRPISQASQATKEKVKRVPGNS